MIDEMNDMKSRFRAIDPIDSHIACTILGLICWLYSAAALLLAKCVFGMSPKAGAFLRQTKLMYIVKMNRYPNHFYQTSIA